MGVAAMDGHARCRATGARLSASQGGGDTTHCMPFDGPPRPAGASLEHHAIGRTHPQTSTAMRKLPDPGLPWRMSVFPHHRLEMAAQSRPSSTSVTFSGGAAVPTARDAGPFGGAKKVHGTAQGWRMRRIELAVERLLRPDSACSSSSAGPAEQAREPISRLVSPADQRKKRVAINLDAQFRHQGVPRLFVERHAVRQGAVHVKNKCARHGYFTKQKSGGTAETGAARGFPR